MVHGASIVCVGSIDWAFNWHIPQEVASAFGAAGNRVLYVENTGVRRVTPADAGRLWARLRNWSRTAGGVTPGGHGVDVLAPLLLPFPYSRAARVVNGRILLRSVRRWLDEDRGRPVIVITFLPTPLARILVAGLDPSLVVYYCIDRLAESSRAARKVSDSESRMLGEADLVLVTAHGLLSPATRLASRVALLPAGVRCEAFERGAAAASPPVFAGLSGPVIGFIGSLRTATDLDLVTDAARLAPDLNFVFVGPRLTDVRRLAACPNVRLVGAVPHAEVVRHVVRFDVGILPYVLNSFTADVMPMKLKEYLAAGLPVVATPLPEVCRFADEHGEIVAFATDAPGFVTALRAALASNGSAARARRVAVARRYDWTRQISRMSDLMESALAARRAG